MSLNAIQEGEVITLAAPYDVVSGAGAQVGAIFGVAQITALSGVDVPLQRCGVWELAKVSAQAWSVGDTVWWDNSAKKATNVKTMSNLRIGKCVEAAANPTSTGKLVLTPDSDAPRIVWGQATTVAASDTIATGLSLLVGVVAQFDSDIVADPEFLSSSIGDQAGAPAAGSFLLKTWKTAAGPVAASTFGKKVNWVAFGY